MAEEEDNVIKDYPQVSNNDEIIVVCTSCRTILDAQRVMNSSWYGEGMLPPCFACGGVTMEIPESAYNQFLDDSRAGKRFLI